MRKGNRVLKFLLQFDVDFVVFWEVGIFQSKGTT